jgi:hypothetical protein
MNNFNSYNFVQADNLSLTLFSVCAVISYILIFFKLKKEKCEQKWIISFTASILLVSLVVISGLAQKYIIPILPIFMFGFIRLSVLFSFSISGKILALNTPVKFLIGFQLFRLPLELLLHHWSSIGTIPETMTWSGSNIDVFAGIISLLSIPILGKWKSFDIGVNTIGFLLLLNVLRVVVLSSPFPFSWQLETPLLLGVYFPYVLIVPLFVIPALIGHLISFRRLISL